MWFPFTFFLLLRQKLFAYAQLACMGRRLSDIHTRLSSCLSVLILFSGIIFLGFICLSSLVSCISVLASQPATCTIAVAMSIAIIVPCVLSCLDFFFFFRCAVVVSMVVVI